MVIFDFLRLFLHINIIECSDMLLMQSIEKILTFEETASVGLHVAYFDNKIVSSVKVTTANERGRGSCDIINISKRIYLYPMEYFIINSPQQG